MLLGGADVNQQPSQGKRGLKVLYLFLKKGGRGCLRGTDFEPKPSQVK